MEDPLTDPILKVKKRMETAPFMSWSMNLGQKMELLNKLAKHKLHNLERKRRESENQVFVIQKCHKTRPFSI